MLKANLFIFILLVSLMIKEHKVYLSRSQPAKRQAYFYINLYKKESE